MVRERLNPFVALYRSRKFLLLLLDGIMVLAMFFVDKYLKIAASDTRFTLIALQPVFVTIIGAIAYEDVGKPVGPLLPVLQALFRSRKFWLLALDTAVAIVLHYIGAYAPAALEDFKLVVGVVQPIFVAVIAAIAYEDVKRVSA